MQRNQPAAAPTTHARPIGPAAPALGCFLNLSNHPLRTWSASQIEAARALGWGEPADLPEGMPHVAPEASTADVLNLASRLVQRTLQLRAGGVAIAGEYTLTLALVARLQAAGVRCYAATSRRVVLEERLVPDGALTIKREFRFERWREYGWSPLAKGCPELPPLLVPCANMLPTHG